MHQQNEKNSKKVNKTPIPTKGKNVVFVCLFLYHYCHTSLAAIHSGKLSVCG